MFSAIENDDDDDNEDDEGDPKPQTRNLELETWNCRHPSNGLFTPIPGFFITWVYI